MEEYVELFYFYLSNYKKELRKIKEESQEKGQCGYYPFSPIIPRTYDVWVMDFLKAHNVDTSKPEKELLEIDKDLFDYVERNRATYFENVYCDLKKLIDCYKPDFVLESGYTFEAMVETRTYIEIFSMELEHVFDISEDLEKVRGLDEAFKIKIKEAVKEKTYSPKDKPFAPGKYWWLHLEDVYSKPKEIID